MFRFSLLATAFLFMLLVFMSCSLFRLGAYQAPPDNSPKAIYVATNGNDANAGTSPDSPVLSIQTAISNAGALGLVDVYVQSGIYSPGGGLNSSGAGVSIIGRPISLRGGYDPSFQSRTGHSELEGGGALQNVVFIQYVTNFVLDGFVLRNGFASGGGYNGNGGGLCVVGSVNGFLSNLVLSNNVASFFGGGGVYLCQSSNITISGSILISNYATGSSDGGGGIMISNSSHITIENSMIGRNCSDRYGGGYYSLYSTNLTISNSSILSNQALNFYGGGIIYSTSTNIMLLNSTVSFNNAFSGASGVYYLNSFDERILNCDITNNGDPVCVIMLNIPASILHMITISNNTIGGTNGSTATGILEINGDTYGHTIVNNIFLTNTVASLYYDLGASNFINTDSTWTNINATNYTGASFASGNTVQ